MGPMQRQHDEDNLNELMPKHFKSLASLDHLDEDTLHLDEYLGSKQDVPGFVSHAFERSRHRSVSRASVPSNCLRDRTQHGAVSEVHTGTGSSGQDVTAKANLEQKAGGPAQPENIPPRMDALTIFLSNRRQKGRGLRRQGTGRMARQRTFGLDLKQLAQQRDGSDSEAEWDARDEELAKQRAERSAQRQREKESRQRRQLLAGKRQSMGPQEMDLDSGDDDAMEDLDFGGGCDVGDETGNEGIEGAATEADGAWNTNPLFDVPGLDKQPVAQAQQAPPLAPPALPKSPPVPSPPKLAQTEAAPSLIPTQVTPPPASTAPHTSLSAQAQKLAEQLLAKVGAAVTRAGAMSDGGTQTTPSLELLALEERPRFHPPVLALPPIPVPEPASAEKQLPPSPVAGGAEGSPLAQDVNAAMAMAAQVAEDIDFPAVEGSPPPAADSLGAKQDEQGPRKLGFGSPVDAELLERGGDEDDDDQPEVLDNPPEEPIGKPATHEPAPQPQAQAPAEDRALIRNVKRKPAEKFWRLKSMLLKSRRSLAGAGLTIREGVRRSTRVRVRPLQWWRNESLAYERLHDSLPTIASVVLLSPDPIWPRHDGRSAAKLRGRKLPALTFN